MPRKKGRRGKGSNAWKHKKEKGGVEHFGTTMIKRSNKVVGPSGGVAMETEQ
jgi:hypothetical protein